MPEWENPNGSSVPIALDRMMAAVGMARHNQLKPYLRTNHFAIGSINSPMQCMMKEICGQCLQPHKDPETGKYVGEMVPCNYVPTFFEDIVVNKLPFPKSNFIAPDWLNKMKKDAA